MYTHLISLFIFLLHCCYWTDAFSFGALLRQQPKGLTTTSIGRSDGDRMKILKEASEFFVDAWWTGKVDGGMFKPQQRESLERIQFMDFRGQYAGSAVAAGQAELILCQIEDEGIIGCAGLEVTSIPATKAQHGGAQQDKKASTRIRAPLMSNVAVSRQFRRKGIAELLVKEAERVVMDWGHDKCYLYVDKENIPAVRLYQKLGYREVWEDRDGKIQVPTANGNLQSKPTTIVCMKKALGHGILGRLSFPF